MKYEGKKRLIFLIGFMGAGKSFIARAVNKRLGWNVIDLDKNIQLNTGQSINEIFKNLGESEFRNLERASLHKLIAENNNAIISTGGGAPCFFDNMQIMNRSGFTIFISKPIKSLLNNLIKGADKRPLLKGKTRSEKEEYIKVKLQERNKYYRQAHYTVHDFHDDELVNIIYYKAKEAFNLG